MENETPPSGSSKKKFYWIAIIFILLLFWLVTPWISPGSLIMLKDYLSGRDRDKEIQSQLDEIVKSIQPAAARNYQFHAASAEASKRTIDCTKLRTFQSDLPIINPVCLNLYRTTPEEINKKVAEGNHDRVIVYGENIIWDAPIIKDSTAPGWDLGKAIYESARFNDQITLPRLFALYGFSDASFVNKLTPNKAFPFSALYYRLGNEEEVKKVCQEENAAGCAFGMWSTIIPQHVLGDKMSLANQKVWRISDEKNPDYLAFDYQWPENCYTEGTLLHETAHLLLYAERIHNISDALVSLRYFNEHQADVIKIMSTNLVCGEGSVSNFRAKNGQKMSLLEFNSTYPPTKMGSAWPDPKKTCQLAMLNEWNKFMAGGDFEKQFTAFTGALKSWMENGKTISNDKDFSGFLIQLRKNEDTERSLQYHGCFI